jgi:alcohol sulfotransferase
MKFWWQALRQFTRTVHKKLLRLLLRLRMRLRGASEEEYLTAERRQRGAEQVKKLRDADIVVVSFGKSGRTWLRVMISHLFQVMYDLPKNAILGFDNFHGMNPAIPRIFFTHDNYVKDLAGDSKAPFYDKRVVLLARDPRDVAVSQSFQWKFE